jgi:hypothetical protein
MDTTGCVAMSQTLFEPALQTEPIDAVPRPRHWTRWPQYLLVLVVFLWVVDVGISLLIRHTRLQKKLTARLESVFGRSVEVGRYNFSLWGGPALQAQSVTFSDDPRFGYGEASLAESFSRTLATRYDLAGESQRESSSQRERRLERRGMAPEAKRCRFERSVPYASNGSLWPH